jgi:prolyl-tRNA synthetase
MMQDGKALQMGTSHNLGQNFSKAFEIRFEGRDQKIQNVWTTSWGVSTRLIGAMIMAHSDDEGLVLPPRVAPTLAAIIPIFRNEDEKAKVLAFIGQALTGLLGAEEVAASDQRLGSGQVAQYFYNERTAQAIVVDKRDQMRPGEKHYFWEQRGAPLRIEVGPRDCDAGQVVVKSRLDGTKEFVAVGDLTRAWLDAKLDAMQKALFARALAFRDANITTVATYAELKAFFEKGDKGFLRCHFIPSKEVEAQIKTETKATVRCIPFAQDKVMGTCMFTGQPTDTQVVFGISY